jgi:glycosyltransferase involved in cell wall biosynthesis
MTTSVVVCSCNQSARLRLVLRALAAQEMPPVEIIVVDDASTDDTAAVLTEAATRLAATTTFVVHRNEIRGGAAAARNHGARLATGETLLFLDGDALPTSRHVATHAAFHAQRGSCAAFGALWHVTTTEFLADPIAGTLMEVDVPEHVRATLNADPEALVVTEDDVAANFEERVVRRSRKGTYPSLGPMEEIGERLGEEGRHEAAWLLMTPQNFSVPRLAFAQAGGFDPTLPFSEGWDLLLTLRSLGVPVLRVAHAPIYHLYHHRPLGSFPESLRRYRALVRIAEKHACPGILLAQLFFAQLAGDPWLPHELGPYDLDHIASLVSRSDLGHYEILLRGHPILSQLASAAEATSRHG